MMWLFLIPAAIVLFLLVICVRAAMFKPKSHAGLQDSKHAKTDNAVDIKETDVDLERAIKNFREMIKIETTWNWMMTLTERTINHFVT